MYLRVPLYRYKPCSTYEYLCTSISSVTHTGDLNKYNFSIGKSTSFVTPTGDSNNYKSAISTSICKSLLYEFMNNFDICYCIFVTVICLL